MACLTFGSRWRYTFSLKVLSQGLQCCLKLARSKKGILSVPADSLRSKDSYKKTKPMLPGNPVLILRLAKKLPTPLVFPPAFWRISEHPEPQKQNPWAGRTMLRRSSHEAKRGVHRNAIQQNKERQCHCDFAWVEEKGGLAERGKQKDKNIWFLHHLKNPLVWTEQQYGLVVNLQRCHLLWWQWLLASPHADVAMHLTWDVMLTGTEPDKVLDFLHSFRWGLRSRWEGMDDIPQKHCEVQGTRRDCVNKLAHPSWYGKILHMYLHSGSQAVILLICLLSYHAHYFEFQLFPKWGSGHEPCGGDSVCHLPALLSHREVQEGHQPKHISVHTDKLHLHCFMQAHRYG